MACLSAPAHGSTDSADGLSLVRGSLDARASADSIVTTFDAADLFMRALPEEGLPVAVSFAAGSMAVADSVVEAGFMVAVGSTAVVATVAGFMVAATAAMAGTDN